MVANRFAKIEDLYWLDLTFVALMSPESLNCDGARSITDAIAESKRLRADYAERHAQLAA